MGKAARKEKSVELEVDEAIEELMETIDDHPLSLPEVPKSTTIELLKGLRTAIELRIETITQEMQNDEEEDDRE